MPVHAPLLLPLLLLLQLPLLILHGCTVAAAAAAVADVAGAV
jgi:hypothetical protein